MYVGMPHLEGMILLEIVLSVALFVLAAAVVGSALRSSIDAATRLREQAQAANYAESALSEMLCGITPMQTSPPTVPEDQTAVSNGGTSQSGASPPGQQWTCETILENSSDAPNLRKITVIVRNDDPSRPVEQRLTQWIFAPDAAAGGTQGGTP
jgi:type II secretory pathway pseudopilin PulG